MPLRKGCAASVCLFVTLLVTSVPNLHAAPAEPDISTGSVWLRWTATGDDGMVGRASVYDLRYSANPILGTDTLSWWNRAAVIDLSGRVPPLPGQPDSVRITGLAIGYTYFALMRIGDEVPNWSRYSNLAVMSVPTAVEGDPVTAPAVRLHASPNPFGSNTVLEFTLPESQDAEVAAYDARGRLVRRLHQGAMTAGTHRIAWDGRDQNGMTVGSGIYFLRVRSKSLVESAKVFRLR